MQTKTASEPDPQQHQILPTNPLSVLSDLAIISTIPLVQAIINDAWLYSFIGYLDPWMYFGYGLNYADPIFLSDNYKVARLPWVLMEFAARHIFDAVVASWVLELGTLALASASLYFLFSRTLGRSAAFVGAALFAAYPFAHASAGVDYHNTLAGPLYCLTWWLAIRTADLGLSAMRLFWTGAVAAATIHTNIVFISLMPVLSLHYFWEHRDKHNKLPSLLPSAVWSALGAIAITVLLCLINKSFGRAFLFFMPQLKLASSFIADPTNQKPFWHAWSTSWYLTANYLGPFAAALLFATVTGIVGKIRGHSQVVVYSACYVIAASLWIFWQSAGQTALDWDYFAYPLVFPFVGFIAAAFSFWAPQPSSSIFAKLAIPAILIGMLASYNNTLHRLVLLPQIPIANATLFGLFFCAIILSVPKVIRFWAALVTFAAAICFSTISIDVYAPSSCHLFRALESAMDSAHRSIRAELKANGMQFSQAYLWAEKDDFVPFAHCPGFYPINLSYFQRSLASTGFNFLEAPWNANRFEEINQGHIRTTLTTGGLIVFITNNAERVDQLRARYSEFGSPPTQKRLVIIEPEMSHIPMYIFRVAKNK